MKMRWNNQHFELLNFTKWTFSQTAGTWSLPHSKCPGYNNRVMVRNETFENDANRHFCVSFFFTHGLEHKSTRGTVIKYVCIKIEINLTCALWIITLTLFLCQATSDFHRISILWTGSVSRVFPYIWCNSQPLALCEVFSHGLISVDLLYYRLIPYISECVCKLRCWIYQSDRRVYS